MAAVDRRIGMVRRGTTPTAPKPINLPSQKLESQGLVPDVEIVPRGTFCWGSAGRSSAASNKNNEGTESASLSSGSTGAVDLGTRVQNALVPTNKSEGLAERSSAPLSDESSASPTSSPVCITLGETTVASSTSGACISDKGTDSRSPADSDAGSLPDSVAHPSSFQSGTSPSATPMAFSNSRVSAEKVEEQKKSNGFPVVGSEDSDKVPNLQPKLGTHDNRGPLPGSQDFGYFEAFYSNQPTFSMPGMTYSNGPGMAFGPGLHSQPSQHNGFYSFLGVPYYDSTRDKEIVVITMVGNPGFHGSYLPHSGFPDQYGRPGVYGNFPLQFGHFEDFGVPGHGILEGMPPLSADMNPMCSVEQGEFACYEQEYYKDGWANESSVSEMQRGNGAHLPTSFSTFNSNPNLQDYSMPKKSGRQKFSYWNKKAASKGASSAAFTSERRVTLLTKVSQHEVVISSLRKKSKHVGNRQAVGLSGSPFFAQNSTDIPSCDSQCKTAIATVETSNTVRVHEVVDIDKSQGLDSLEIPPASEMILDQATYTGLNNEGSNFPSASEMILDQATCTGLNNEGSNFPSASEMILDQATCTGLNNEGSNLQSSCNKDTLRTAFESSSTSTSTSTLAYGRMAVCHQDTLAANCPGAVPAAPSTNISSVIGNKDRPRCEVRHVTFNADDHIMNAAELNASTESIAPTKQVNEHVNGEETLSTTIAVSLPHEHNEGSMRLILKQKTERKWRRKVFVAVAKLGQEYSNPKVQEAVGDKKALSLPSSKDKATSSDKARDVMSSAGAESLPISTIGGKPVSQYSVSLSSCAAAATLKENFQGDCTEPVILPTTKKSKKVHKTVSANGGLDSVAEFSSVRILESSKKTTMRTISFEEGQSSDSKRASCGFGKAWRLKPAGDKAEAKVLRNQASNSTSASKFPAPEVSKPYNRTDPKCRLEVSCDDNSIDRFKQEQSCSKHSHEDMQNESCDRLSVSVDKQHTSKNNSLTCVTGIGIDNLGNREEMMEGRKSTESLPLRNSRVEERGHSSRPVGKQKLQQQASLAGKTEEPKHTGRVDMPTREDSCFEDSGFEACGGYSSSSDANLGVDHKISKATSKFTSTSQVVPALQVKKQSKENENASLVNQQCVNQPVLATQCSKFKDLTSEVNQSSKPASGLLQQSSLRNCQEQRRLPVRNAPQRHAGPAHTIKEQQPAGSLSRSTPVNLGTNCMKQGHLVTSWGENSVKKGESYLDTKYQKINQNRHHLQEGYLAKAHSHLGKFQKAWNYEGQSMHRWQQQKKWIAKPAITCSSVSKPFEGSRTCPDEKSNAGNKQYVNLLQGVSGVSWKPKQTPAVQISIEGSLEGGKDNPSTPASQREKTPEDCRVPEPSSSAPMSHPCGNGLQVGVRMLALQVREASEVCTVVMSSSSALLSPACGSEQQVNNMGEQGSVRPVSQSKLACDECAVVTLRSCALSAPACGDGQQVDGMVIKAPVKPASQITVGPEDTVTSFSSAPLSSSCGNGQEVANTVKQSYKAALERQHPAVTRKVTSSEGQVVAGPISQPVSSLAISLKLEDTPIAKTVKSRWHYTSWRPKAVSGSIALKSAFSKEVKENDPSASTEVEGAPKKHTHPLPSTKSAALNDLHVWKNNGRHSVRASYGLPYWRKEYPQQQKSVGHQPKLHAEGIRQNRANEKFLEREFPGASFMNEVKHVSPQKPAETSPGREHPGSYHKFPQHHACLVKQAQSSCNQHSPVGNCRHFSTKSNFSHDDNKKVVRYLSRIFTPMEQGNRRPFSTKSNFSHDDSKKVVHHQESPTPMEQGKARENFSFRGMGHVEGLCPSRSDNKPAKRGRFHNGWKVADFDRKGWVAKPETRC